MTHCGPYLLFDGVCAEAMAFYHACFGGDLTVTTVEDSPMRERYAPEQGKKVINARLQSGAIAISASDWLHPTRTPKAGNTVCLYISECPAAQVTRYFEQLAVGADPSLLDALTEMPFGLYGALTDKYGVRWMFAGDLTP